MPREMCINLFLSAHNVKMQAYCVTNKASVGCWQSWRREHEAGGSTELPSSRSEQRLLFKTRRCSCWCALENPSHPEPYRSDHSHQMSFFLLSHSFGFICRVAWWEARLIKPFYCLLSKPDVGGGAVDVSSKAKMEPRPRRRQRAGLESPRIAQITEVVEDCSLIISIFLK